MRLCDCVGVPKWIRIREAWDDDKRVDARLLLSLGVHAQTRAPINPPLDPAPPIPAGSIPAIDRPTNRVGGWLGRSVEWGFQCWADRCFRAAHPPPFLASSYLRSRASPNRSPQATTTRPLLNSANRLAKRSIERFSGSNRRTHKSIDESVGGLLLGIAAWLRPQ